MTHSIYQ